MFCQRSRQKQKLKRKTQSGFVFIGPRDVVVGRRIERERGKHRKHEDNGDKKRWHGHFASIDAKTIDGPAGEHECS